MSTLADIVLNSQNWIDFERLKMDTLSKAL